MIPRRDPVLMMYRIVFLAFVALGSGCTSVRTSFPGRDPDQVWTAMVAAAQTPDYSSDEDYTKRWIVRENQVWVDEPNNRIEIYRKLERDLYRPASRHLHEDREWKMQITMDDRNPPTAKFTTRQLGVPAHTWEEAERYFEEVQKVLEAGLEPATQAAAPPPESPQSQPESKPLIDIKSLEPTKP